MTHQNLSLGKDWKLLRATLLRSTEHSSDRVMQKNSLSMNLFGDTNLAPSKELFWDERRHVHVCPCAFF